MKRKLYARAGIPEYWIVDLRGEGIERYSRPAAGDYAETSRAGRGGVLASQVLPELRLAVDEVLGPQKP